MAFFLELYDLPVALRTKFQNVIIAGIISSGKLTEDTAHLILIHSVPFDRFSQSSNCLCALRQHPHQHDWKTFVGTFTKFMAQINRGIVIDDWLVLGIIVGGVADCEVLSFAS